jgi:hypothetical protein
VALNTGSHLELQILSGRQSPMAAQALTLPLPAPQCWGEFTFYLLGCWPSPCLTVGEVNRTPCVLGHSSNFVNYPQGVFFMPWFCPARCIFGFSKLFFASPKSFSHSQSCFLPLVSRFTPSQRCFSPLPSRFTPLPLCFSNLRNRFQRPPTYFRPLTIRFPLIPTCFPLIRS